MPANLRKIFREICEEATPYSLFGKPVFFKHLNIFDQAEITEAQNIAHQKAIELGIPTEEERVAQCIKKGVWSKDKDDHMESLYKDIERYQASKKKLAYEGQLADINRYIETCSQDIHKLKNERRAVIGRTAEDYAILESNTEFVFISCYKDPLCRERFWSREEFDYIDRETSSLVIEVYDKAFTDYSINNIRKICVESFFARLFGLAQNPAKFFEKPVFKLTNYQIQLLDYGRYYKGMLEECFDAPQDVRSDPDKLEEFYLLKQNNVVTDPNEDQKTHNKWSAAKNIRKM